MRKPYQSPGPETIKKSGAWIGAQLTILCSINRKVRSGYYKEIGPETIKKSRAWIGAQLTILCSINRKLKSGDYKEIGVRFLCSV